jgi:hypothetical protein
VDLGQESFALASLGDLMELLVEGWRIRRMHYADRSGASGPPAALFELERRPGEERGILIPDDGRALSHRALVSLFRESPAIWKHRSADAVAPSEAAAPSRSDTWGAVPEPFPEALVFTPATLTEVVPVGQVQSVDGLDIALIALERHDAAARVRYMCHASDARTRRQMAMLDVVAVDDGGRLYRVAPVESRPEGNRLDGALAIAPAIPLDVRALSVAIGTVRDEGGREAEASGPWIFPIRLV